MSKVWLVAQYHFRQETGKRSFLFLLFMLPLFLTLAVGVGYLNARSQRRHQVSAASGLPSRIFLATTPSMQPESTAILPPPHMDLNDPISIRGFL